MVLFNYSTKELTAKIVYYGPGLCGKTTNLQYIHGNLPVNVKGKMLSLATKTDRTLFFDFLPIDLGEIRGMKTRVQLYTVPGQVFYNETRKLVLKGADGIVFVADSQEQMLSANAESFKNLEENLKGHGLTLAEMPHVIQFNKRDLPKLATIEQINQSMNKYNAPFYESVATTGIGIQDTLKAITKLVLLHLTRKYDPRAKSSAKAPAAPAPAAPQAPAAPTPAMQAPAPGPAETQAIPLTDIQPALGAPTIAIAADAAAQAKPEPAMAASVEPAASIEVAAAHEFDDSEIDQLVGEVEELEEISTPQETVEAVETVEEVQVADAPFEIDESNIALAEPVEESPVLAVESSAPPTAEEDEQVQPEMMESNEPELDLPDGPEFAVETAIETDFTDQPETPTEIAAEATDADASAEEPQDEVLLTQVADDDELFNDPNLDVASVAPGEEREIVIPVEMGAEGETKRFKLSVRLRLDPVD